MPDEIITAGRLATLEANMKHMTDQQDKILVKVDHIERTLSNLACKVHDEKLTNIETDYVKMQRDMICVLKFKDRFTGKFAGAAAVIFILLQAVTLYRGWVA